MNVHCLESVICLFDNLTIYFSLCYILKLQALDLEKDVDNVKFVALEKLCNSYQHTDEPSMALKYCSDALEISQTADLYCLRADGYIANSMFEEGMENI